MSGTISKQISQLIYGVESLLGTSACNLMRAISLTLTSFVFAYQVNLIFFAILGIWSVCLVGVGLVMAERLTSLSENQAAKENVLGGETVDSLINYSSVILFARREYEIARRNRSISEWILLCFTGV